MKINEWYDSKLEQFGENDFRSLNWGDKEGKSAKARYQQMFEQYDWSDKKILEIGCGWGSFFDFGFKCDYYHGIDINPLLIDIANKKYKNYDFTTEDISNHQLKSVSLNYDVDMDFFKTKLSTGNTILYSKDSSFSIPSVLSIKNF